MKRSCHLFVYYICGGRVQCTNNKDIILVKHICHSLSWDWELNACHRKEMPAIRKGTICLSMEHGIDSCHRKKDDMFGH